MKGLSGAYLEALTKIISDVFSREELTQLIRFKLGVDFEKDTPAGADFQHAVFLLIERSDREGIVVNLIDAVLTARPNRNDVKTTLGEIRCSLTDNTANPRDQVAKVSLGVAKVLGQLENPAIRKLVQSSEEVLQKLARDINSLRAYKNLHDSLHIVQLQLRTLITAARNLKDGSAAGQFAAGLTLLRTICIGADSSVNDLPTEPPDLKQTEADWLARLREATERGSDALRQSDPLIGRQSVQEIRSVLRQEPPRIDGILRTRANALELGRLGALFDNVAKETAIERTQQETLIKGRIGVEQLVQQIKALVNQHGQWQRIDNDLWEADDNLPRNDASDPADFDALWANIRRQTLILVETEPNAEWAQRLKTRCDLLVASRGGNDWSKIARDFADFRAEATVRFFQVDTALKELAGVVTQIGNSLDNLLENLK